MVDLKRSKKFAFKLFVFLYFDVFAIQPNFFVWSIATIFYSFFIDSFLQFLCME